MVTWGGQRPRRRLRRRRLTSAALLLGIWGLAGVAVVSGPVGASTGDDGFVKGNGAASAAVYSVVAKAGPLPLPIRVGHATATYDNSTGVGEASTINLGFFKTIFTSEICNFTLVEDSENLPQSTRVDSNGSEEASAEHRPGDQVEGSNLPKAGYEMAVARRDALGFAKATPAAYLDVPGLVTIEGGTAESSAQLVPGESRAALATVELGTVSLGGGQIRLAGLRWEARQESSGPPGTPPDIATGSFSGRLQMLPVLGVYTIDIPIEGAGSLQPVVDLFNALLGPGLVTVHMPKLTVTPETGAVEMSPLILRISGGSAVAGTFGDVFARNEAVRQVRKQVITAVKGGECDGVQPQPTAALGDAADLILGVLASGLQGNGGIDLELGGVTARTQAKVFEDPFGSRRPPAPPGPAPSVDAGASRPAVDVSPPLAAPSIDASRRVDTSTVSRDGGTRCLSVHPKEWPACSSGRAGLAIGLAVLTTVGLFAGDLTRSQRARTRRMQGAEL